MSRSGSLCACSVSSFRVDTALISFFLRCMRPMRR